MLNDFLSRVQKERETAAKRDLYAKCSGLRFSPSFQPNSVRLNCCTFFSFFFGIVGLLAFSVALLGRVNKAQQEGGIVKAGGQSRQVPKARGQFK